MHIDLLGFVEHKTTDNDVLDVSTIELLALQSIGLEFKVILLLD